MKKAYIGISRKEFLNKILRIMLISVLAVIAFLLGGRVSSGQNCSECAGKGLCRGESDCSNYLNDAK
jgi:hypothetical protein